MLDSTLRINQDSPVVFADFGLMRPLFIKPPLPSCEISIVIPVRDEAENLNSAFRAVTRQLDFAGNKFDPRRYEILVLANNCVDNSAAIVREWQLKNCLPPIHLAEVMLPASEANCGRARQIVMEAAYLRLKKLGTSRRVIASTDGDTRVAPDWVAATLAEINRGADAVSGRIIIEPNQLATLDDNARRHHLRDVCYRHLVAELETYLSPVPSDPRPRHYQHFNASFAVTVEAYQRAGGVPTVSHLEDFAFYQSLLRIDARFRHSPHVRVFTSARREGRTTCGLSTQLAAWTKMPENSKTYLVEGLNELEAKFVSSHQLRHLWQDINAAKSFDNKKLKCLAEILGIRESTLKSEISRASTFGLLREAIEQKQRENGVWRIHYSLVPIVEAIASLRLRLEKLRRA